MSKRRNLSPEEAALWQRATDQVKRRFPAERVEVDRAPDIAAALIPRHSDHAVKTVMARPAAPLQSRENEKRVRRGRVEIEAVLDLHGHTQMSGRAAVLNFLSIAQASGAGAVLIITGIGRSGTGMLKQRLPEWLNESQIRPLVSGYAPSHRRHGGAGAMYVFIKRQRVDSAP